MSLVSVVLPVYNPGGVLRAAIESILAQTTKQFELIIINDASTDDSRSLIDQFVQHDARLRAIHHPVNHGLAVSLNEGIASARGELVARMDQDDIALPERLELQTEFMARHPEVAVVGSWVFNLGVTQAHDRLIRLPFTPGQIRDYLPRINCIYHPTVMLRRKAILDLGGYRAEFKNAEDYDLWLRVSQHHLLANIPQPLLRYRLSTTGMTMSRKWEQLYYFLLAQESNKNPTIPTNTLTPLVKRRLAKINRQEYFDNIAYDAVRQLQRLGFHNDAINMRHALASELSSTGLSRLNFRYIEEYPGF